MIPHRKAIRRARKSPPALLLALALTLALALALPPGNAQAGEPAPVVLNATLAAGSDGLPAGWRHVTFPRIDRATRYQVVEDAGRTVLRAHADRSASLLVWEQEFDPREFPLLTWEWKLGATLAGADLRHKATDDAAARVLVLFPAQPGDGGSGESWLRRLYRRLYGDDLPTRGLAYVAAPALSATDAEVTHQMPAHPLTAGERAAGGEVWLPSAYTWHMMLLPLLPPSPPAPLPPSQAREGEGGTAPQSSPPAPVLLVPRASAPAHLSPQTEKGEGSTAPQSSPPAPVLLVPRASAPAHLSPQTEKGRGRTAAPIPGPSPERGRETGRWQRFRRDLAADYPAAFGKPLPSRARLAIMVDTDNTQQETVSEFAALQVARR